MEAKVLAAAINSREAYQNVERFLEEGDFSERGRRIFEEVSHYYEMDAQAGCCDTDIILSRLRRSLSSRKQAQQFEAVLESLSEQDISAANVSDDFLELKTINAGDRLARAISARKDRETVEEALERYAELREATSLGGGKEVIVDLASLFAETLDEAQRYKLLPGILNRTIGGGVTRGDSIVVFGRPNAGKSTFVLNAAYGFVRQGLRVVFMENEDSYVRTLSRFGRRMTGKPKEWCKAHPEEAAAMVTKAGGDLFHLFKLTPGTPRELDAICAEIRPDVLIVNQIRGMAHAVTTGGNLTAAMEKVAVLNRNIGQKYNMVLIQVTQANAPHKDREGNIIDKPVMFMEDIDSSLTGVPGAADFVIAVGTSRDLKEMNRACLSIAKSKDDGDGEHMFVTVDPDIGRIKSK